MQPNIYEEDETFLKTKQKHTVAAKSSQPAAGQILSKHRGEEGGNCAAVTHASTAECVRLIQPGL